MLHSKIYYKNNRYQPYILVMFRHQMLSFSNWLPLSAKCRYGKQQVVIDVAQLQ